MELQAKKVVSLKSKEDHSLFLLEDNEFMEHFVFLLMVKTSLHLESDLFFVPRVPVQSVLPLLHNVNRKDVHHLTTLLVMSSAAAVSSSLLGCCIFFIKEQNNLSVS